MELKFIYPNTGYFFYDTEEAKVTVSTAGNGSALLLTAHITDYNGDFVSDYSKEVSPKENTVTEIPVLSKRLGYYRVEVELSDGQDSVVKVTGVGITSEYEALSAEKSKFGLNTNRRIPEYHFNAIEKMGMRMVRITWPHEYMSFKKYISANKMKVLAQWPGGNILGNLYKVTNGERYAPPKLNKAYYAHQQTRDLVSMYEFGNEFSEEHALNLSAEWTKDTGLARLTADNLGWYSPTGLPGVDINKLEELYRQGVFDYVTFLGIHPYSFPNAPENPNSFWSLKRLEDLAAWMELRGIDIPVAATEFGYPALYDQTECEVYSPGDMADFDGQIDYVVRSYLTLISYGVVNSQLYNGPWCDGFGIMEKDGPAPWPAAMALCEMVRQVDKSEYIGNYYDESDPNVYFLVFRKENGLLFAVVWKVVYYSRSCRKELNFAIDNSGATQADGTVQEIFNYRLHYVSENFKVTDVMGNRIENDGDIVIIGERPIYIHGINEDIIPLLTDKTIFKTKTVEPKATPSKIILGIQDSKMQKGAFLTSKFVWGETRKYLLRVHNYENFDLNDILVLDLPDGVSVGHKEIPVFVPAGEIAELSVEITCEAGTECGIYDAVLSLKNNKAASAIQIFEVSYPVRALPVFEPLAAGKSVDVEFVNFSSEPQKYEVKISHCDIKLDYKNEIIVGAGKNEVVTVTFGDGNYPVEAKLNAEIKVNGRKADCEFVIPIHYIEKVSENKNDGQLAIITGYNLQSTFGDNNKFGALLGMAKPESLVSYNKLWLDDEYLYAHFDIKDDTVLCAKLGRRNNIDCDGVWIRLYRNIGDESPYRYFVAMPLDQAGRTEGASVDEIAGDVLFDEKYSDYNIENASVKANVYDGGYTLDLKIKLASIELSDDVEQIIADIRVIDMNHNDWPKLYDTGKIAYVILKK